MQKEQIVGMAVRLFAIFLFLNTLRHVSGLLPLVTAPSPDNGSLLFILVLVLCPILAAVLMWFFPLSVATKIIPNIKGEASTPGPNAAEIETVAFSVMGLWVLTFAISDAIYWLTYVLRLRNADLGYTDLAPEHLANIVATVVELAIGLWLLFGSRGILEVLRRLRRA